LYAFISLALCSIDSCKICWYSRKCYLRILLQAWSDPDYLGVQTSNRATEQL